MTVKQCLLKYWMIWSVAIAVVVGLISKSEIEKYSRSRAANALGVKSMSDGELKSLEIMSHIDSKSISDDDVERLDNLSMDPDEKTRVMAFATIAHMANHGDRKKALQLLGRVDTDKSPNILKKKLWWHFVARCDDWRQLAKDALGSTDADLQNDAKLALENDPDAKKNK